MPIAILLSILTFFSDDYNGISCEVHARCRHDQTLSSIGYANEDIRIKAYHQASTDAIAELSAWLNSDYVAINSAKSASFKSSRIKERSTVYSQTTDARMLPFEVFSWTEFDDGDSKVTEVILRWRESSEISLRKTRFGGVDPAEGWKDELAEHVRSFRRGFVPRTNFFIDSNGYVHLYAAVVPTASEISSLGVDVSRLKAELELTRLLQLTDDGDGVVRRESSVSVYRNGSSKTTIKSKENGSNRVASGSRPQIEYIIDGRDLMVAVKELRQVRKTQNATRSVGVHVFNPATGKFE